MQPGGHRFDPDTLHAIKANTTGPRAHRGPVVRLKRNARRESLSGMMTYAILLVVLVAAPGLRAQSSHILAQQPIELVVHVPVPSPMRIPAGESVIHFDGPGSFSMRRPGPTIIVDGVLAWPIAGASEEDLLHAFESNDIKDVQVLKGERAVAAGACSGAGLIIITTKSGRWRPKGYASRTPRADCSLLEAR